MTDRIGNSDFSRLCELSTGDEARLNISTEHGLIPVCFRRGSDDSQNLLILFHGAVDRRTREVPAFVPFFNNLVNTPHQLSISDPAILNKSEFSIGWYAGYREFPLQTTLRAVFERLSSELGVQRTVFFGTSSGGFAALYYAWNHGAAVAVVVNPQTRITSYYETHVSRYFSECWSEQDGDEIVDYIDTDVCALYRNKFTTAVVYIQSAGDHFHLLNHLSPFLSSVANHDGSRLVVNCDFWGRMGHHPSFEAYLPWVNAALLSEKRNSKTLLETYYALCGKPKLAPRINRRGEVIPDPSDIHRANLLRDIELKS